jgi:hypothetical protein
MNCRAASSAEGTVKSISRPGCSSCTYGDLGIRAGQAQPHGVLGAPDKGVAQAVAVKGQAGFQVGHVEAYTIDLVNQGGWFRFFQTKTSADGF